MWVSCGLKLEILWGSSNDYGLGIPMPHNNLRVVRCFKARSSVLYRKFWGCKYKLFHETLDRADHIKAKTRLQKKTISLRVNNPPLISEKSRNRLHCEKAQRSTEILTFGRGLLKNARQCPSLCLTISSLIAWFISVTHIKD